MQRRNFFSLAAGATTLSLLPSCSRHVAGKIQEAGKSNQDPFQYKGISRSVPTADELEAYYKRFNNWGRWGKNDELGTLNFINEKIVLEAKDLIRQGKSIPLGRPLQTVELEMLIYRTEGGEIGSAHGTITVRAHGYTETHIDALNHISSKDGKLYNGYPETDVTEKGAIAHGIEHWKNGIVTRGVLYDITELRGIPHIPLDKPVMGWELEDFARKHKIIPQRGDAVIIHCGRNSFFRSNPGNPNTIGNKPGLNPSVLEFVHEYEGAIMGSDFDEAPNTDKTYPTNYSIYHLANPFMGLPTFWNIDLEKLSENCKEKNKWDFSL